MSPTITLRAICPSGESPLSLAADNTCLGCNCQGLHCPGKVAPALELGPGSGAISWRIKALPVSRDPGPGWIGRGREIRTPDPLLPKQMRYQTAPCPHAA